MKRNPGINPDDPTGQRDFRRVIRSIAQVEWLLILLATAYYVSASANLLRPTLYVVAVVAYGAVALAFAFRAARWMPAVRATQVRCAVMTLAVTLVLVGTGPGPGATMVNLYLLPLVGSALLLARRQALVQLTLVIVARAVLAYFWWQEETGLLNFMLGMFGELAPLILTCLLIMALTGDIDLARRRIENMEDLDGLTGLPNMRAFTGMVSATARGAAAHGQPWAILKVNIDSLKEINDQHGHDRGDEAIVAVAQALRRSVRSADVVARFGGDEFVICLPRADEEATTAVANRIRHNVFAITLDFVNMKRLQVSVGSAVAPRDGSRLQALMTAADHNMAENRALRRGQLAEKMAQGDTAA